MEKYIKYSIFTVLTILIISACEKGELKFPDPINGSLVYLTKDASTGLDIDYFNLSATDLEFNITLKYGEVRTVDIICVKNGDWANKVTYASGITLPGNLNVTFQGLLDAFSDLTSEADFNSGDSFFFYPIVYTEGGLTLALWTWDAERGPRQNYDADIAQEPGASLEVTYNVVCPTTIIPGFYDAVSNGTNTDGQPEAIDLTAVVEIVSEGGTNFTLQNCFAGVYEFWYCAPYGYCFTDDATFSDICGDFVSTFNDAWGQSYPATGTIDQINGTITYSYTNAWGDQVTTVLTPQ